MSESTSKVDSLLLVARILTGMPATHAFAAAPVAESPRLAALPYAPVAVAATSQPAGQTEPLFGSLRRNEACKAWTAA